MNTEIELKFQIAKDDISKLQQHPLLQAAAASRQEMLLYATYYDTPQQDLLRLGIGLRVRREKGRWVQSVKSAGKGTGGLHRRREWEIEVTENKPDFSLLPESLKENFDKSLRAALIPLFTTEFHRVTWQLHDEDHTHIELCLDQGKIQAGDRSAPLSEIELELKKGKDIGQLYTIILSLLDNVPLIAENASKAQRGYELHRPIPPQPHKAEKIALVWEMSAEDAFIDIIWNCLAQLQANESVILHGKDIEGVHQMRVALRRLYVGLNLYRKLIPLETWTGFNAERKWLIDALAPVRDNDVFAENVQYLLRQMSDNAHLQNLQQKLDAIQQKQYTLIKQMLCSPRYNRFLYAFSAWLHRREWRTNLPKANLKRLRQPLSVFAEKMLSKQYKRLRRKGKNLLQLTPTERHRVRIASKKLAYSARFFSSLYPGEFTQNYLNILSDLRDDLGALNDAATARQLLQAEELGLPPDHAARCLLEGWYCHQDKVTLAHLKTVWEIFLERKPFWK